jgi:hypothetical protein
LLSFAQTAPVPPHVCVCALHVTLSVQSAVARQKPPIGFSKHRPPTHLPDRHWLLAVQAVPGHEARQMPPRQLPLWHCESARQAVPLPYGILQVPLRHCRPSAQVIP